MADLGKKFFGYTKEEWSWVLQDTGNSAYSLVITATLFPLFYKAIAGGAGLSDADSTAYLSYANSIGTAFVGLLAPILGSIAEYRGFRKPLFTLGTLLGIGSVLFMAFTPSATWSLAWLILLILYVLSNIGFSASNIFYDASLLDVTDKNRMSRVSSMGYGMGYIGSCVPFLLYLAFMLNIDAMPFSLDWLTRAVFVLTAVWWFVFTIPYWQNVKQKSWINPSSHPIRDSFTRVKNTIKDIAQYRQLFIFLLAYFLYIDGVGTIISMATAVATDLGIEATVLVVVLLIVQIVAFPFTVLYGQLAKGFGDKKLIYLGIFTYIVICIYALSMKTATDFFILACMVGTAQGGLQALSRSMFGKLVPKEKTNEFFGIYNVFGKFSSIIGTTLLGVITQMTGNSLNGVFGLIILFIIGGILLLGVKEDGVKG